MEAQGGAEVRRLHIVYFLSHKGRIEHPHLIRVQHLSRNGVRLRDVKRWLGDLRGKEIPESFSWSYKRRYKTGYVWQDLLDDDLITPISDNEYVLKGSEISNLLEVSNKQKEQDKELKTPTKEENHGRPSEAKACEIEEESPTFGSETSTLTDDSARADKNSQSSKRENPPSDDKTKRPSAFSTLFTKKNKKKSKKVSTNEEKEPSVAVDSCKQPPSEPQCPKSKTNTNGASQMLRNLITCGDVDTNDSVKAMQKQRKLNMCSSHDLGSGAISKRDSFGGSQRIYGNPSWTQTQWIHRKSFDGLRESLKGELREQRTPCAPYKPANGPSCSQCGKPFKPEKMLGHMRSCKMKAALAKCAVKAEERASMEFGKREAASGQLLTH